MPSPTPSPVPRGRSRVRSRSRTPDSSASRYTRSRSRSPRRSISPRSRSRSGGRSRSRSLVSAVGAGRSGGARYRSESRGRSLSPRGRSRTRSRSRGRSESAGSVAAPRSTKVVIEKLTKNVTEDHLREIFGSFGEIKDLDVPMNRNFNTNRGTAYILYVSSSSAESAIAHMHEAQLDGAVINVSIVLPRRKFSPQPPMARRGVNIDPRIPIGSRNSRGGFESRGAGSGMGGGGRLMDRERDRGGDTYRPGERNPDHGQGPQEETEGGIGEIVLEVAEVEVVGIEMEAGMGEEREVLVIVAIVAMMIEVEVQVEFEAEVEGEDVKNEIEMRLGLQIIAAIMWNLSTDR
ncbi:hypothetical protein BOTNAR_0065g00020 [Botryotinia narcissicola]|uniref:RRM domain-containing protein n=1 Tax=Botryotinia narcissicola TaxID=278944 RepID=A0A4Z1IXZ5_9HELO|nr:hypothetical protein BOTNAR_0065g00020 [Botryotinia narcissicola]